MRKIGVVAVCVFLAGPAFANDEDQGFFGRMWGSVTGIFSGGDRDRDRDRDGFPIYVGVDYVEGRVSVSDDGPPAFPAIDKFDTNFYKLRLGTRLGDAVGLEGHFGISRSRDDDPGFVKTDNYYGIFLVPTATVFQFLEVAFPLGLARIELGNDETEKLDGVAYGMNLEFPLRALASGLPDLRLVGGGMVYQQDTGNRTYGYHGGLRFDF